VFSLLRGTGGATEFLARNIPLLDLFAVCRSGCRRKNILMAGSSGFNA